MKKKPTLGYHRLTIDMELDTYKLLKKLADKSDRTASKQAKVILAEYLNGIDDE